MTNKPKVKLIERDQSTESPDDYTLESWHRMFEGEDRAFTESMFKALDQASPPYRPGAPVMVLSTPTGPHKSIFERHFRDAFPGHFIIDEAHIPYKPLGRSHLYPHQIDVMSWLDNHPAMQAELNAFGGISFDTETYQQPFSLGHMPMIMRPRFGVTFGGHMSRDAQDADRIEHLRRLRNNIRPWSEDPHFAYSNIGGQFKFVHDSVFIEDEYVAPPKKAKDWDSKTDFWYRSAMSGKHMTNLAVAAYRASKKDIYNPEFNWQGQHEARRRLHHIKHVNVGTVGHIDWGNNRMKRARPYFPGYLADCIREAIKGFK